MAEINLTTFAAPIPSSGAIQQSASQGISSLGQGDFLKLMIAQLQQQDPFEPVDNKDMLAQMAQFTSLAGTTETNDTLQQILTKLDNLIAVQVASNPGAAND